MRSSLTTTRRSGTASSAGEDSNTYNKIKSLLKGNNDKVLKELYFQDLKDVLYRAIKEQLDNKLILPRDVIHKYEDNFYELFVSNFHTLVS